LALLLPSQIGAEWTPGRGLVQGGENRLGRTEDPGGLLPTDTLASDLYRVLQVQKVLKALR
jgi:hypothetical protein